MPTPDERRADAFAAADDAYNAARSNPDLSQDARTRKIAVAYVKLRDTIAAIIGDTTRADEAREDALSRRLYGIPAGGDGMSYRDALDRARQIDFRNMQDALDLQEQARKTGDELLTKAILCRAYEARWSDVINAHTAANPRDYANAEELWELGENTIDFAGIGANYVTKPRELAGVADFSIDAIAQSENAPR